MSVEIETLFISEIESGLRIDKCLSLRFPNQSRTYFQYLLEEGLVSLNGKRVKKRESVKPGDEIDVHFALTKELNLDPENIPLDILYEDAHLIVINKPAGLVVHPAPGHWKGTLVNALLYHCRELECEPGSLRPGIVHRLDKDTSGALIAAKTRQAHQALISAFAQRTIHKEYLSVCIGQFLKEETIDLPIGRHPILRQQMAVNPQGRWARTHCYPLGAWKNLTLIRSVLETGRTHQIRVHLKSRGLPILGDGLYGNPSWNQKLGAERQLLHAHKLQLTHPISGVLLQLEAPLPADLTKWYKIILNQESFL